MESTHLAVKQRSTADGVIHTRKRNPAECGIDHGLRRHDLEMSFVHLMFLMFCATYPAGSVLK